ncbi:unnamed protein product [Danaus chrysippus]|uniref:(African queen) hypothetical protein n=1 Tax=Danaus chrysippus TaxID=151541 RepID=A0A8J2VVR8_9NEOP|nr:unnamed protein product [Danaus chrysippus]
MTARVTQTTNRRFSGSYPGPKAKDEPKRRSGRSEASRPRRRKRKFCRPVPNSRLYRPAPPRARPPPPPSPRPRAAWSPPAGRVLESASRVALRVLRARSSARPPSPPPPAVGPAPPRRPVGRPPPGGDAAGGGRRSLRHVRAPTLHQPGVLGRERPLLGAQRVPLRGLTNYDYLQ